MVILFNSAKSRCLTLRHNKPGF